MPDQPREEARWTIYADDESEWITGPNTDPIRVVPADPLRALADEWEAAGQREPARPLDPTPFILARCARQLRERIGD